LATMRSRDVLDRLRVRPVKEDAEPKA